MLRIEPSAELVLGHAAYHLEVARSGHGITVSREGDATLFGPSLERIATFRLRHAVKDVAIAHGGDLIAVVEEERLRLLHAATRLDKAAIDGRFDSAAFSVDGRSVWTSRAAGAAWIVERRDIDTQRVVARAELDDPFGDSSCVLFAHPGGVYVIAWIAAGQDGQCIRWLHEPPQSEYFALEVSELSDVFETTPPVFNDRGDRFAITDGGEELRCYAFPSCELLGRFASPFGDDDMFGDHCAFVDDDEALVFNTNETHMHLLDLASMTLRDEVVVAGHELRPTRELFPGLDEDGFGTDLDYFRPLRGGAIISVHGNRLLRWRI